MFTSKDYELYEDNFEFRLIAPHTWMFGTKGADFAFSSDCYLLEGETNAIMVDSGMNTLDFKAYIDELKLTDKPILGAINTHSHFDHTGGNGFFGRGYMHPLAKKGATTPFGTLEDYASGKGENPGYILDYPIEFLKDGDVIDLGGRKLEILEIGSHDPSGIAILDHGQRILFTGDELETGWCNIPQFGTPEDAPGANLEEYYEHLLKLKSHWDEFDIICPGHHGAPIAKETLDYFLEVVKSILDGAEGDPYIPKKNGGDVFRDPNRRVMRYKSVHLCYDITKIHKKK